MSDDRLKGMVAIVGTGTIPEHMVAALHSAGVTVVERVEETQNTIGAEDQRAISPIWDDRLDALDRLYGRQDPFERGYVLRLRDYDRIGMDRGLRQPRKPYHTSGRELTFIDTPKPLGKRAKRRARAKSRG